MRRMPTDAERKVWLLLRSFKPLGMHFRRQTPIGVYIADFAWLGGKLVVEIDGGQHAQAQHAHDLLRTAWLESQGYRVLRFWNHDVLQNPDGVGEAIVGAARMSSVISSETPSPTHPHEGEGSAAARGEAS